MDILGNPSLYKPLLPSDWQVGSVGRWTFFLEALLWPIFLALSMIL